ncbi:N-acetyl-gamma-glutamyl-phosphate reductase [PVC group bacterium (ex Bugula neritina AB1)]|nr:N-acetyl-gamma-glutamyl-phosphate reductase [PVC group bacterium (ex Bugula neritina AB1)]
MLKASVVGASGYIGAELVRHILKHPFVELSHLAIRDKTALPYSEIFPEYKGICDIPCSSISDSDKILETSDIIFFALPHGVSMNIVPEYWDKQKILIDLSGDYRLNDIDIYQKFYKTDHTSHAYVKDIVYGLSEIYPNEISSAKAIANPGCFPTAIQLALYPFLKEGLIVPNKIMVDAKTGISGGGKAPQKPFHYPECNENIKAYKLGNHQHTPEIEQSLSLSSGENVQVTFVPHLAPMIRGIFATHYIELKNDIDSKGISDILHETYKDKPFVRILPCGVSPEIKNVIYSNFCDISFFKQNGSVIVMSAIDNLIKGAAGQAIQNMNIMSGFPEETGLLPC